MQTVSERRIDRRPALRRLGRLIAVSVLVLLLVACASILPDGSSDLGALARAQLDERVGLDQIPASFPSAVHRNELVAVAEMQSHGLLVPTWLPAEGMSVGRPVATGDGNYDLWFVASNDRYVHVVGRPAGVGSPLVEVSGFSTDEAKLVRESLRVLAV